MWITRTSICSSLFSMKSRSSMRTYAIAFWIEPGKFHFRADWQRFGGADGFT